MTTDTEALREQFEAWARKNELEAERHKYADDQYDDHAATSAWWAWRDAFQAGHAAAKAEAAWIPVAVLPAPCLKVIATYANRLGNRRTIMAKWVPGRTEEAHSLDDEFGEYDEATDTTYAPEGWYEVIDNCDDCTFVAVSEGVITHWMPLPEAPDAIRAGAPPDTLPEAGALRQSKLRMNDTEADCQAWAYFNKWCRGGGV